MDLIKRLFGGGNKPDLAAPSQIDARPENVPVEVDPDATKRRELVRVVTRDTLRAAGIPDSWVESHILLESSRSRQPFIHLRLVVKHWDGRLLKYAVAFQRKLLGEIIQFEPGAREWLLSISWLYDVGDECPVLDLPEPSSWGPPPPAAPAVIKEQAPPRDELQEDLALLYAVRDADLAAPTPDASGAQGKAKPVPSIIPDILL